MADLTYYTILPHWHQEVLLKILEKLSVNLETRVSSIASIDNIFLTELGIRDTQISMLTLHILCLLFLTSKEQG